MDMLNIKELEEMGKKAGFSYVALLKSDSIQLMPEVREMCKNNTCHMYAKRWSCPPGCGDLEVCRKKIEKYREGIIVQTVGKLEDPLDGEMFPFISMQTKRRLSVGSASKSQLLRFLFRIKVPPHSCLSYYYLYLYCHVIDYST